ncbi:M17 family metallopeptidase [Aeromonas lusitana]|uniref:Peptidase M17 n=1 Tax=Aeromonas lusitana TaxID=931529 RepID=A0A2M8H7V8_9GAMM|nr:leucyl aminopeptidase family protein [Aeromonas lusitana]PJC92646.1 peptidase M17 [Aeromonas lusitana]
MVQPFRYLPPALAIESLTLTQVLASAATVKLLLLAETERDKTLAQPEFAGVAAQIALGQKAPYRLADRGGLQLVVFLAPDLTRDHKLYKQVRGWLAPLAGLNVETLALHLAGFDDARRAELAELVLSTLLAANVALPHHKQQADAPVRHQTITISPACALDLTRILAEAEGNGLARHLAVLPASDLTPQHYRALARDLAREEGWQWQEFDETELTRLGAGAFLAVARGSDDHQAAIVKLSYRPANPERRLALVGKGICHDSGGYNLKVGGSMYGMHLDMGGSAVALGTLLAISRAKLPLEVHCWLAIAENHIGPKAYRPGEVVTAINGTTIEVVDTDAEGRMVLADALAMAAQDEPDLLIDYATLTGACKRALGSRYSGAFTNRPEWLGDLISLGQHSGERVWPFPLDEDYDDNIESEWADLLQCAPGASPDHIDAARFLSRFVPATTPWLHLDLSGFRNKGGNGVVSSEVTGFGVRLTLDLLASPLR